MTTPVSREALAIDLEGPDIISLRWGRVLPALATLSVATSSMIFALAPSPLGTAADETEVAQGEDVQFVDAVEDCEWAKYWVEPTDVPVFTPGMSQAQEDLDAILEGGALPSQQEGAMRKLFLQGTSWYSDASVFQIVSVDGEYTDRSEKAIEQIRELYESANLLGHKLSPAAHVFAADDLTGAVVEYEIYADTRYKPAFPASLQGNLVQLSDYCSGAASGRPSLFTA